MFGGNLYRWENGFHAKRCDNEFRTADTNSLPQKPVLQYNMKLKLNFIFKIN
jgi:hypothetical protein